MELDSDTELELEEDPTTIITKPIPNPLTKQNEMADWVNKFIKSMFNQHFGKASHLLSSNPTESIPVTVFDELHASLLNSNNYGDEDFVELFTDLRSNYSFEFYCLYDKGLPNVAKRFLARKTKSRT
jgi:hypothetical protein